MWNMIFQYPHSSYFTLSERSKVKGLEKKAWKPSAILSIRRVAINERDGVDY